MSQNEPPTIRRFSSRSILQSVEEMGHLAVWARDLQNGDGFWSPSLSRFLGVHGADEFLGMRDFLDLIHPEDKHLASEAVGNDPHAPRDHVVFRLILPHGTLRWIRFKSQTLFLPDGRPGCQLCIAMDVTDQQHAVETLSRRDRRARSLIDAHGLSYLTISSDGGVIVLTDRTKGSLGPSVLSCDKFLAQISPVDRGRIAEQWKQAFASDIPVVSRYRRSSAQELQPVNMVCLLAPVFGSSGQLNEWAGLETRVDPADTVDVSAAEVAGAHVRAARALLDWSIDDLALRSGISASSIRRFEGDTDLAHRSQTVNLIKSALESSGIVFSINGAGLLGVALRAIFSGRTSPSWRPPIRD